SKTEIKAQKEKSGTQAAINPIITRSKGAHLVAKMNEFNQANPNAIAAAKKQNADKVKASYEEDLNRALASVPFDVYAQHSTNQWQPEGILRQAHDALRQEYGIKPPIEPDQNAPQSEWDKYDADNEAFYGNDEPYQPPTYKSIEQQKAERLVEKEAERIKLFRIIPDQVKRGADFVQSQADLKNAGVYLDAGHSNNEDRNNHRAYAEFKKTATPKQLKALSDYEKYIRAVNETTRSQDTKAKETAVSTEAEAGNAGSQSSDRKMLSPLATPDEYHYKEAQSAYQHSNRYGAQAARDSYVRSINNQHDRLNKDLNEAQKQYLDDSFIQLKKDYLEKEKPILAARSGMVSAHIAGRSKFDGRLATRGQSSYDRATEAHSQWFDREIGDIERGILNRRNDEQKASDKKKTDNKIVNKTVGAFAGSIGAMDEPGYDKSAFMPGARKQWAAIRALGDDVALNAIENINKVLTEESKTIEDVLGKRSKLWKEISEFLDSDTIKQQSSKQLEESKDAPDKAVVQPSNGQASGAEVDVKNELSNSVDDQKQENINDKTLLESHKDLNDRLNAGDITAEELKAEFEKLVADKDAAYAELNKLTKADLTKMYRVGYQRPDAKKADVVKDAYQGMLADFKIADGMISYGMTIGKGMSGADDGFTGAVRKFVNDTTDADIKDYAEQIAKAKEERAAKKAEVLAGMDNPETADDFGRIMRVRFDEKRAAGMEHNEAFNAARMEFTPEQREKFDSLVAEETRGKRQARADQQKTDVHVAAQTTEGQVIETKHTKTGADLFVVKAADRVDRDVYNHWNTTAKRLGGYYSSFKGAGAVPGFQFKTRDNADAFLKFLGGDVTDAKEAVQARRDAYADDKSQTAVERLNEMADRLEERGTDSLNQDRKANTHRHVGMAARAEAAAQSDIALAKTMRNIASAIESGDAKLLDRVRQKVQVEMLQGFIHSAQSDQLRKLYPNYADYERHQGEKPNKETADYAMFPQYTAYRSDLANLGRTLLETEGTKKLGQRIMKVADDVSDAYLKFAKDNIDKVGAFRTKGGERAAFASKSTAEESIWRSDYKGAAIVLPVKRGENLIILSPSEAIKRGVWKGDNDKKITLSADFGAELVEKIGKAARLGSRISVPWQFENAYDKRKRLAGMGIETPAELRSALREFIGLREAPKEADKIKEMERAMVGRQNDGLDFFPTPAGIADEMIDAADIKEGMSVLEPSAGMGHIAERIREAGVEPDVVELSNSRRELLEAKGFNVVGRDFMDINPREFFNYGDTFKAKDGTIGIMHGGELGSNRTKLLDKEGNSLGWFDRDELTGVQKNDALSGYDRIIMNPPFGDRRDALHVQHAYDLLNPGGRLVAIMGEGVFFGNDKKAQAFRDWLEQVGGTDEKLAEGTFNDPSLPVNTGVNARMVVIDKPEGDVKFSKSKSNTTNPHTEQSLLSAIRAALDSKFYSGWTDAAMATGKFKVISRDEALKISSGAGDAKGFYDPAAGGDTS
ncbi:MAG: hypothetical protein Q8L15_06760, partial [Methylobacter sp.]|nr:hypothetical protein [Methylobacter sp.]